MWLMGIKQVYIIVAYNNRTIPVTKLDVDKILSTLNSFIRSLLIYFTSK